ncbi:MAG: YIP1 family protein [candidate division Zixibacteria bacterium]|nr:YIP1 family protein [candidate division Zixibacteria bacterium]MDH3939219.1 YIP1 family protein [candidate division Zixibacteria bacterium]
MDRSVTVNTDYRPVTDRTLSFRGLAEVFYSPTAFFEKSKERPSLLAPFIAFAVLLITFSLVTIDISFETLMERTQEQTQGRMEFTPEEARSMKRQVLVNDNVVLFLVPLIAAGLCMLWGNLVYPGAARFKQVLSVMLYGEVIYAVGKIVLAPLMLIKQTTSVSLSLAVLAPYLGESRLLPLALSRIDLFLIWEIVAIGIGLSIIYDVSRNRGYLYSVLSMGLLSVCSVLFRAVLMMQ